ncbi:MAG: DNA polymerase III subunit chi [Mesorhizobium amorphae]|nr:MAG: DNA polymerase III subunit chi [Mesorhizobium amorphae]
MTEVLFYHLTESTLEDTLPGLLERSRARGWRVAVQCGSAERRDALDAHLWSFRDDSFLAHGLDREPFASDQPILLTTEDANPNGAQVRFLVDNAPAPDLGPYERAVFLFDGHDQAQLDGARQAWTAMKALGHAVTYWQQTPDRRWERKA